MLKTRKIKGFTLVELIVVIAIIAVLAAILVPTMMGWIKKSKVNTSNTNAKACYTAAQTVASGMTMKGWKLAGTGAGATAEVTVQLQTTTVVPTSVEDFPAASVATTGVTDAQFVTFMVYEFETLNNSSWQVVFDPKGRALAATWGASQTDTYIGGFPRIAVEPGELQGNAGASGAGATVAVSAPASAAAANAKS